MEADASCPSHVILVVLVVVVLLVVLLVVLPLLVLVVVVVGAAVLFVLFGFCFSCCLYLYSCWFLYVFVFDLEILFVIM